MTPPRGENPADHIEVGSRANWRNDPEVRSFSRAAAGAIGTRYAAPREVGRPGLRGSGLVIRVSSILFTLILLVGGIGSARAVATPASIGPEYSGVSATVTWDGTNVSAAGAPAAAFTITPGQSATVHFVFSSFPGGQSVTTAEITTTFLGLALSSEGVATGPLPGGPLGSGQATLNWSFGSLFDLTEGVYQLTASLLSQNTSPAWSETFYVDAKAPYVVGAGIPLLLIVLGLVETYWVVSIVRAGRKRRGGPVRNRSRSAASEGTAPTAGEEPGA